MLYVGQPLAWEVREPEGPAMAMPEGSVETA